MNKKNTAKSGRLIKAVYASYVYVYILCASYSGRLEYNSLYIGQVSWGEWGNVSHSLLRYMKDILLLLHLPLYFSVSKFPIVPIRKNRGSTAWIIRCWIIKEEILLNFIEFFICQDYTASVTDEWCTEALLKWNRTTWIKPGPIVFWFALHPTMK